MANLEKGPQGVTEEIKLEQGFDALVLTTTQKEVFLNTDQAQESKKRQIMKERVLGSVLRCGGGAVVIGYIGLVSILAAQGVDQGALFFGGVVAVGVGGASTIVSDKFFKNASLASRQLKEIQSNKK